MKNNKEMIRKALLLGLGAASFTAEAVEDAVNQLRIDGGLDEGEARALVREVFAKSGKQQQAAMQMARKQFEMIQSKSPFALKADFTKLETRVRKLESKASKPKGTKRRK